MKSFQDNPKSPLEIETLSHSKEEEDSQRIFLPDEFTEPTAGDDDLASSSDSRGGPSSFCWHSAFFLGALFGTVASLSDLRNALCYNSGDSEEEGSAHVPVRNPFEFWTFYKMLSVASTLMYLLDSFLHDCEAYTMDQRWMVPLLFGSAAGMDLLSCVVEDEDRPWPSVVIGSIAVHLFLLSALVTIYDNYRYYGFIATHRSMAAIFLGDLLFLAGSIIDVCLSYWDVPGSSMGWVQEASWSLASSLLWLIDSLIYRWADVKMFEEPDITLGDDDCYEIASAEELDKEEERESAPFVSS